VNLRAFGAVYTGIVGKPEPFPEPGLEPRQTRAAILTPVAVAAVLASVAFLILRPGAHPDHDAGLQDFNSIINLGRGLIGAGCPVGEDGHVDPYALLRTEDLSPSDMVMFCASIRQNKAPTLEQIEAGDYSEFPWERHWGPVDADRVVPLLWENEADKSGYRIVAFTNGAIKYLSNEKWTQKWASLAPRPPG
jgi:hypothetical protein